MSQESGSVRELLAAALAEQTALIDPAAALFDYAQFLLDDDARLTKSGALDSEGRTLLQRRAIELLGGPPPADDEEAEEDDE
jgi:hypothetical protein